MTRIFILRGVVVSLLIGVLAGCVSSEQPSAANTGNEAFANGNYDEALVAYSTAQAEFPAAPEPLYNTANVHYRQEDYASAQQLLADAASLATGELTAKMYFNQGNSAYNQGNWEEAIAAYENALRLNPDDIDAKTNLELALQQLDQQQTPTPDSSQQPPSDQNDQTTPESSTPTPQPTDTNPTPGAETATPRPTGQSDEQGTPQNDDPSNATPTPGGTATQQSDAQATPSGEPSGTPDSAGATSQPDQMTPQPTVTAMGGGDAQEDNSDTPVATPIEQGMTQEQAQQLLAAIAGNTETIQEHLNQIYVVPGDRPAEDW